MAKRLIVRHGERVTRHELTGRPIVIGRDPSCDLFFSDHKLSRRHARLEPEGEKLKLVDLGSRNGCWVNGQRVEERVLEVHDAIRLGGLSINYEEDRPSTETESTIGFGEQQAPEDQSQTLKLTAARAEAPRTGAAELPDDTVLFSESRPPDRERTVVLPESSPPGGDTRTIVLPGQSGQTDETMRDIPALEKTTPLPREGQAATELMAPGKPRRAWNPRTAPILMVFCAALAAYALVAIPLVVRTRSELRQESLRRGRELLYLLRAANASALGSGRVEELSLEAVLRERGVEEALLLDPTGRVLAPKDRVGETYDHIEGIDTPLADVSSFLEGRRGDGARNLVVPLNLEGRRVGVAILTYSPAGWAETAWVPVLLALGLIVIVGGAWAAFVLAARQGVPPPSADTEATLAEG